MLRTTVLAALALALTPAFALAQVPAPLGFKEFLLGQQKSAYTEAISSYFCISTVPTFEMCSAPERLTKLTMAGADLEDLTLWFHDGILKNIYCKFSPRDFDEVVSALQTKYGKGQAKTSVASNAMGAKFENATVIWKVSGGQITARKYAGSITDSVVTIQTKDFDDALEKATGGTKEQRAKDL